MIFSSQLGKLDGKTSEQAVKTIANHLRKIQEELEYRLGNLDSSNVTEIDTGLTEMSGPLVQLISETEGNVAQLKVTSNAISGEVAKLEEGLAGHMELTALKFQTAFGNEVYNVASEIEQTASRITQQVLSDEGYAQLKVDMEGISGTVGDLVTGMSTTLKVGAGGVGIVDQDGKQVTISGGQINAQGLVITSDNLPSGVAMKTDIPTVPTKTSELTNNSGFTSLKSVQDWVDDQGFEDSTGIASIINGTVTADFVNALKVSAAHLSGNVISVKSGIVDYAYMYAGQNSAGTTAFELVGTMGLRLTSPANVYLASYLTDISGPGAQITMDDDSVSIGGILRFAGSKNYGYSLPKSGYTGQVFFLLTE